MIDQYFKAITKEALLSAFYILNDDGITYTPAQGLSIAPIPLPEQAQEGEGDGVSYYINIRADKLLPTPDGVTAVTAQECIPVTGVWA